MEWTNERGPMRKRLLFLSGSILMMILASACASKTPDVAAAPAAFKPTATVKELMDSVVDPNADYIWNAVATTVTAEGTFEKAPQTDDEWQELRRHTIALLEATNLLLVPERHVARPGEKAEDPRVELAPDQIETMINEDRATWTQMALNLYDSVLPTLKATDAKDKEALLLAGDSIDLACEGCHLKYWYPNDKAAQANYAERLKIQ